MYGFVLRHPAYLGLSFGELALRLSRASKGQVLVLGAQLHGHTVFNPPTFTSYYECVCFAICEDRDFLIPLEMPLADNFVL
jgi:hypothetical protein